MTTFSSPEIEGGVVTLDHIEPGSSVVLYSRPKLVRTTGQEIRAEGPGNSRTVSTGNGNTVVIMDAVLFVGAGSV